MQAKPPRFFTLSTSTPRPPRAQRPAAVVLPRHPLRVALAPGLRLVQRVPSGARGLAIGYGFPEDFALPGWGLVLSGPAPGSVDLAAARRLASVQADAPLLLIGDGAGVKTVFSAFIANQTGTVAGAAFFEATYPTDDYSLSLWVHLAERSAARKGIRLLTDLRAPDKSLAAILGGAQAPADGPKDEAPAGRVARLLAAVFGPSSSPMPRPLPPVEHLSPVTE